MIQPGTTQKRAAMGKLWNDVYPPTDDDHDDGSETGSEDTFAVGSSDSEGSGEDDDSDEASDVEDPELAEERAYEFTEMTDADWAEVSEDLTALAEEKQQGEAGGCFDKTYSAHELSFLLASSSTPLARMEFVVYSALRRLLEACAPTLKVLSLSWNPISTFFIEAVFPLLPQLRVLRWDRDKSDYSPLCGNLSIKRRAPAPHVFPALHHLDIKSNNTHNEVSGLLLMCPDVRLISVSQDMLGNDWSIRNKKIRIRSDYDQLDRLGHLDEDYVSDVLGVRGTMRDNKFYAAVPTNSQYLKILLTQLTKEARRIDESDMYGEDDPRTLHAIDVCTDLIHYLGSS
ncbi:hypothetical protein MD484_g8084, partial [Candolleomyces efflorescens]